MSFDSYFYSSSENNLYIKFPKEKIKNTSFIILISL